MQRRDSFSRKPAFGVCVAVMSAALLVASAASTANAQQLKPYFLVIFDTSGSMTWCAGGNESQFGANDCSCLNNTSGPCFGQNATPADSVFKQNRCGFPANRLGDAKCALQRIVDATSGDAVFGLMQFEHPCTNGCTNAALSAGGANCAAGTQFDDGQLVVGISNNNTTLMREWVDGTGNCQGTCSNNYRHELTAGVFTPITRSLQRANQYLRGEPASGFLYPTNPEGFNAAPAAPLANDPQLACRPVSVILLTDGKDTCTANPTQDPPNAAADLLGGGSVLGSDPATKAFRTYVIGFGRQGSDSYDQATLNAIAMRGGTERFYPAANEAELSAVLNQIIADAQPPMEVCDDMDNDCDGNFDEGIQKFCDLPNGTSASVLCEEPNETKCDGIDDDCDGIVDEGLTNVCGTCGDVPAELCDGVDNDCDQRIDENADSLEKCGTDEGECEAGQLVCIDGSERCQGQTEGSDEKCDCKDNDCDGNIDENAGGGLCPDEQTCAGCQCVPYCKPVQEFGETCEVGLAPDVQPNGECICVVDNCDSTQCAGRTIEEGGDVACAPNDAKVGSCVCRAGACVQRCVGVTCGDGKTCSPRTGECVENNCRGLGCANGELCEPMSGKCTENKCADVTCGDDELCRAGVCEKSCGSVTCANGERCSRGECVEDKCAAASCGGDDACNPETGECVSDPCGRVACARGQVCSVATGECEVDTCWEVDCPTGQSCSRGECTRRGGNAGSPAPAPAPNRPARESSNRLFASTGGGGCACSVPGPESSGTDASNLLFLSVFGLLWFGSRSRKRRHVRHPRQVRMLGLLAVVLLAGSPLLAACKVSPLCIDAKCGGGGRPRPDRDSGTAAPGIDADVEPTPIDDAGTDGGDADAGPEGGMDEPDASTMCEPTGDETCNNKDDDCDFRADEGVVAPANNCLQRGVCAGTTPVCAAGAFGCGYGTNYEKDETKCDGDDNDCDGKIDESFAMLGSTCEVGIGACKVAGSRKCNAAGTGLMCDVPSPTAPGDEVCNGLDDDCDGTVDEPKGEPGMNPSYVRDDLVQVGTSLWVYKYEASRADATDKAVGKLNGRACSRSGVLPWTDLTFRQAVDACEASGLSLCSVEDWTAACKGQTGACKWSYTADGASCDAYETEGSNACNGHDVAAEPGSPDSDVLKPTGSMSECYANFGSAGQVFDLSGNAKELTRGAMSPNQNPLRGGSYNNAPMGLQCDFDFSVGGSDLHLPNVGFRCCTSVAP